MQQVIYEKLYTNTGNINVLNQIPKATKKFSMSVVALATIHESHFPMSM